MLPRIANVIQYTNITYMYKCCKCYLEVHMLFKNGNVTQMCNCCWTMLFLRGRMLFSFLPCKCYLAMQVVLRLLLPHSTLPLQLLSCCQKSFELCHCFIQGPGLLCLVCHELFEICRCQWLVIFQFLQRKQTSNRDTRNGICPLKHNNSNNKHCPARSTHCHSFAPIL